VPTLNILPAAIMDEESLLSVGLHLRGLSGLESRGLGKHLHAFWVGLHGPPRLVSTWR